MAALAATDRCRSVLDSVTPAGRNVTFFSEATNFSVGDLNNMENVFVQSPKIWQTNN
jgi:hypothetical protein